MLLLAFALSYLAMLALSMAMSRHHKALFTVAASPVRQRLLRSLAGLALGLALAACGWGEGGEIGAVLWLCQLMLAGLLLVALLAWRARWVLPRAAALPLAAGLGALL